ncbi:hypothetical protein [Streptomyces sp. SM13]|uniref:hypothetical protein n=1 Tax=Streptomyces sp. SM13 TaxID=1983803 RepID=UPI000CD51459|nr:hypothetical protein [Streptomyces sp. SM13]
MSAPTNAAERLAKLKGVLEGAGAGTRSETRSMRRLRLNRPANVLVAALLHGADRQAKGKTLTDLEERLLEVVAQFLPKEEFGSFGQVYREAVGRGPVAVLPQAVTSLSLDQGYSLADLKAALPGISAEVMAQPNVRVVDASAGEAVESEEFKSALETYARGTTVVTGSPGTRAGQDDFHAVLRLASFTCVKESGEVGKDEIFWGLSAGSDRQTKPESFSTTREYSVSTGTQRTMDVDLFRGPMNQALSCEIQCWEADNSQSDFYHGLRAALKTFAEKAIDVSVELAQDDETGKAAAFAALAAIGAGLLNALLGLFINTDDLVCERSFGFTRNGLAALALSDTQTQDLNFNGGGGGHHTLRIQWAGPRPTTDIRTFTYGKYAWGSVQMPWPDSETPGTPALALFNGTLYCAVRGNNSEFFTSRYIQADGRWEPFVSVPGGHSSDYPPALVAWNGRLHLGYTTHRSALHLMSTSDGVTWSGPSAPIYEAHRGPVLAVRDNVLHIASVWDDVLMMLWTADGSTWQGHAAVHGSEKVNEAPAFTAHQGSLYLAYRDKTNSQIGLMVHDGIQWHGRYLLNASSPNSPALYSDGTTLHSAHRSATGQIYVSSMTGNSHTLGDFEPVPWPQTTISSPALAADSTGRLHYVLRHGDF